MTVGPEGRNPPVGDPSHVVDRLLLERGDVDRDVRASRCHLELEVPRFEERAHLRTETLAAPERAQDPHGLAQVRERLPVRHAMEILHHHPAAGAETEDDPPLGDLVERGGAHREQPGGAAEHVGDAGRHLEGARGERDLGEQLELLVGPRLGNPDRIVAEVLGELGEAQHRFAIVVLPEGNDSGLLAHGIPFRRGP